MSDMTPERLTAELRALMDVIVDASSEEFYDDLLAHIDAQQRTIEQLCDQLLKAEKDISQWIQFGKYLRETSERASHDPRVPTEAGINASEFVREDMRKAFRLVCEAIDNAKDAKGGK